jgi:hypothetical protein
MRRIILFVSMMVMISILIVCCTKTNEEKLAGSQNPSICDTTNVKYSTDIVPILQVNCYSCHGNGSTGGSGGILLDGYTNLKKWADSGFLLGNVTHAPGYVGMPYGQAPLPQCEMNYIAAWVHQGAQNN